MKFSVSYQDKRWYGAKYFIKQDTNLILENVKYPQDFAKPIFINIILSNDTDIQPLNKLYRKKDKPTNILSFNMNQDLGRYFWLGDLILSFDTLMLESQQNSVSLRNHFRHLITHGTLHLLGYDHENDRDAEIMEALEVDILAKIGTPNPYQQ